MKKNYSKPSMKVFNLKQRPVLLCGSNGEPAGGQEKRRGAPLYDEDFAFIPGDMNNIA